MSDLIKDPVFGVGCVNKESGGLVIVKPRVVAHRVKHYQVLLAGMILPTNDGHWWSGVMELGMN